MSVWRREVAWGICLRHLNYQALGTLTSRGSEFQERSDFCRSGFGRTRGRCKISNPMHDNNQDFPIYRDAAGEGEELRRAMGHASAGLRPPGMLLFDPAEGEWAAFFSGIVAERIAAHFVTSYSAAAAGEVDRLLELDGCFAEGLDLDQRQRLAEATPCVFEAREGARAMRLLDRLRERCPQCAYTTAFAAHAAAFNVPLLHALLAYLAVEWRAGVEAGGEALENSREWERMFGEQLLSCPLQVRQLLARSGGGLAAVA